MPFKSALLVIWIFSCFCGFVKLIRSIGGPCRTRTYDQGIMSASKINKLLIILDLAKLGKISQSRVNTKS
jgi:hypothetical protein